METALLILIAIVAVGVLFLAFAVSRVIHVVEALNKTLNEASKGLDPERDDRSR